ncbi:MAG: glutathionylspermidine synthase family protein [Bacteroidales bacterium]
MRRITTTPRANWQAKVEEIGFGFHTLDTTYWDESIYYEFSMDEIDRIEKATNDLWEMCLEAAQHVIDNKLYRHFHIPEWIVPHIEDSWNNDAPAIYGRFDFSMRDGVPKLLEFNADTPTSLFEASVVQWYWLQDTHPENDQFNSIHEKLIAYWKYLKDYLHDGPLHFAAVQDNLEDLITTEYMRDCAIQAGLDTKFINIMDIGWNGNQNEFRDLAEEPIVNIFKLYPWEWLVNEAFGKNIIAESNKAHWIEPSWKMILSNKSILPILWELFPRHENLLPSFTEYERLSLGFTYAKKPILSREGANIQLFDNGSLLSETKGEYGEEGFIYQELCPLPNFSGNYPLIGSWIIGQEAAGIGIRETSTLITDNLSRFVPHLIK